MEPAGYPACKFVASFHRFAADKFFEAELERSGDVIRLRAPSFECSLNGSSAARLEGARRTVTVGIHPEDVLVEIDRGTTVPFDARVDVVETLGAEQHLVLSSGETRSSRASPVDSSQRWGNT